MLETFIDHQEIKTTAIGQRTKAEIYQRNDFQKRAAAANQTALELAAEDEELRRYCLEYQEFDSINFFLKSSIVQKLQGFQEGLFQALQGLKVQSNVNFIL